MAIVAPAGVGGISCPQEMHMRSMIILVLSVSLATFGFLSVVPAASASCTLDLTGAGCAGRCTVNTGTCRGSCEVNTGYCGWGSDCEVNVSMCRDYSNCDVNAGNCNSWSTCVINVREC